MMKDEALKALEKAGANDLYDILYDEDMTIERFVKEYPEAKGIPGVVDALQTKSSNAPHGMTESEKADYFAETPDDRKRYEANESKLAKELSEKQRLAAEYQRAKDIQDFSELSRKKSIGQNLAALGMKLVPQAAKNEYIKKGMEGDIGLQAGLGTIANLSEFAPGIGKIGKAATVVAGPAIRAGQKLYQDDDITGEDLKEAGKEFAIDAGINAASYLPLLDIYRYGKSILGKAGRGDKLAKNSIDETLKQADALENAAAENARLAKLRTELENFEELYPDMSDIERLKFAEKIRDEYPELAKAIEEETVALAKNKEAYEGMTAIGGDDLYKKLEQEAEEKSAKAIEEASDKFEREITDAMNKTETKLSVRNNEDVFDKAGNLNFGRDIDLDDVRLIMPNKTSKAIANAAPYGRGVIRGAQSNGIKSVAPEEKENKAAIDWTIDKYKRQWDAGFAPRGNEGELIMKAYAQYLKDREGK